MKYSIRFLPDTVTDRAIIRRYLDQFYAGTAKRFFDLLRRRIDRIKEHPYSCPIYQDDPDYRKLVVGDYLVFYMIDEASKTIEIHRIFHGSQNIENELS